MFIVVSLTFFTLYMIYVLYKRKQYVDSFPPGPPAWPLVGNLFQMNSNDFRKTFIEWHKKYGPIFTVWFGSTNPAVFITGYEMMHEVFVKRGEEFADRPYSYLLQYFMSGKYGVVNLCGDELREQRRFTVHLLRNFGMGRKVMEEKIQFENENFIQSINRRLNKAKSDTFDVAPFYQLAVANVISSLVVGRRFKEDDAKLMAFKQANVDFEKLVELRMVLLESAPWLRYIPLFEHFGLDELDRQRDVLFGLITDEIEEHKKEIDISSEPTDFTAAYLQELNTREASGNIGYFSEWQLKCILADIWTAGYETTVSMLSWSALLMMKYPEVQQKVQNEIDTVVNINEYPSMNDRASMPYTNAVLQELLRYVNLVPMNLTRTTNKPTNIAGFSIPEGATLVPQICVVHWDEKIFDKPEEFRPERFLENGALKKADELLAFSLGKRSCIGEGLARMEMFLFFTSLLQKFTLSVPDGEKLDLSPKIGILAKPQTAFKCTVSLRS